MEESGVEDYVVENNERASREVAEEVLHCVGWL
jgi:hypothetical protein